MMSWTGSMAPCTCWGRMMTIRSRLRMSTKTISSSGGLVSSLQGGWLALLPRLGTRLRSWWTVYQRSPSCPRYSSLWTWMWSRSSSCRLVFVCVWVYFVLYRMIMKRMLRLMVIYTNHYRAFWILWSSSGRGPSCQPTSFLFLWWWHLSSYHCCRPNSSWETRRFTTLNCAWVVKCKVPTCTKS